MSQELVTAAYQGNLSLVERLLPSCDINYRGNGGDISRMTALNAASMAGNIDVALFLIGKGADVNAQDKDGDTPLHNALRKEVETIVKQLIASGADLSLLNDKGQTPESLARTKSERSYAIFKKHRAGYSPRQVEFNYVAGDRVMQEIYCFDRLERVTYIRKDEFGPVEAFTRDSFASIQDFAGLRDAFAEHVKRKGDVKEEDVFPSSVKPMIVRKSK